MKGLDVCDKCGRRIKGKMVYAGGAVWHSKCYPYLKKSVKKSAVRSSKSKRTAKRRTK